MPVRVPERAMVAVGRVKHSKQGRAMAAVGRVRRSNGVTVTVVVGRVKVMG